VNEQTARRRYAMRLAACHAVCWVASVAVTTFVSWHVHLLAGLLVVVEYGLHARALGRCLDSLLPPGACGYMGVVQRVELDVNTARVTVTASRVLYQLRFVGEPRVYAQVLAERDNIVGRDLYCWPDEEKRMVLMEFDSR